MKNSWLLKRRAVQALLIDSRFTVIQVADASVYRGNWDGPLGYT